MGTDENIKLELLRLAVQVALSSKTKWEVEFAEMLERFGLKNP